jgi:hypothetical protein
LFLLLVSSVVSAQSETKEQDIKQITAVLMDYIEGTALGKP